jgi:hypothetical protein
MKKIVILIITLFLITGCSVKYSVVINEDLTMVEEAKLTGTDDFFADYYKTTRTNVLKSILEVYQDKLDENNYQYELVEDKTKPYVILTKKYDNGNDYVTNSLLFNKYFEEVKYSEDGNIKKIETIGYNGDIPDDQDQFSIRELEISIKCPYKVKNHTAKRVDKETNTYYYELNDENNKILLEYDTSTKFNPKSDLIRTLLILFGIVIASWIIIIIVSKKNKK